MADEYKSLAEATAFALVRGGTAVMDNPQKLLSYLADTMDPDSMEMRVLMRCCDEQLVEPYRQALGNGLDALRGAEARARDHLINECMIEPRTAARVSGGIASGIAARYGLRPSSPQRPAAQPQPAPQPQTPVVTPTPVNPANYTHTVVVTPPSGNSQSGGTKAPAPQAPAQPQPQPAPKPQPQPAPQPQPTPTPVVQQTTQQPDPGPKKKSPLPIVAAVVALVVAAVIVLPRLFGGAGSSTRGVFPFASEDEGVWLVTDSVTVNASGETVWESHNTYDEHGNLLSYSSYTLEDDGTVFESSDTFGGYDEYGYPESRSGWIKDEWTDGSDYESNYTDSYTNDVDSTGRITSRQTNSYTESGNDYSYNCDYSYTYSYSGDALAYIQWDEKSDSSTESGYIEYDEYGHELEFYTETIYDDGDSTTMIGTSTYELASDGTPISELYTWTYTGFDGESSESRTEYEYDEHGTITKSVQTDSDGKTTTTEFKNEYDSNGNLTKRTNVTDNEVTTYTRIYISDPSFAVKNKISNKIRYR